MTGERGLYDGVAETVTLVGNVKSRRPTGETVDAPGANARAVACFKPGAEYVEVTRDPGLKNGKVRGVVPVREKAGGDVEVIDSVENAPLPVEKPATPAAPGGEIPPSPAPEPQP